MKSVQVFKLKATPNRDKKETAFYLIDRYNMYINYFAGRLFFNNNKAISTVGMGQLANQALHKSHAIIKGLINLKKETGVKTNVPVVKNASAPAKLEISENTSFDYIVKISNQFSKKDLIEIPVKSHKALNNALKKGWKLTSSCEVKHVKDDLFIYVFVEKEVNKALPIEDCIGVDVGINKSIVSSDGHFGKGLKEVIKKFKESQKERYRQRMKFKQVQVYKNKKDKTYLKQILDKEAKLLIARCLKIRCSIIIESRKIIQNLRSGRISLWARTYFANRIEVLCKEFEIFLVEVNPYRSSITCSCCDHVDKESRVKEFFKCTSCFFECDADLNASHVLKKRGRQVLLEKIIPKWYNQVDVKQNVKRTI